MRAKGFNYIGGGALAGATIANEGQVFSVKGTETVQYGAGDQWVQKTVNGFGVCANTYFGSDPAPGVVKSCRYATAAAAPTGPSESFLSNLLSSNNPGRPPMPMLYSVAQAAQNMAQSNTAPSGFAPSSAEPTGTTSANTAPSANPPAQLDPNVVAGNSVANSTAKPGLSKTAMLGIVGGSVLVGAVVLFFALR